uniref:BROMI C-terminal Rab TBC-like domain-containing protein n=1 Tax=Globisporangium ultimum (strain ATCC 200006 / CBS 805.95 / DAOM BR144) TaxID=431595 RepID=K3WEE0_GLOUD
MMKCHCSVLTLTLRWLSQCFWNYFDWNNIVLYLYLTILHGREFQVYIVTAVIKHLEAPMKELSAKY